MVRDVLERNARAVSLKPPVGQGTSRTRVRLEPGLACTVEDGEWTLTVGMSAKSGGSNAGPNPGVLGRGALGSCLTIGYAMWAARLGVPLTSLEVTVEADYDRRGELGVDDTVPPGYLQVRYIVTVESPAPESEVVALIDTADKYSSYLDVYRRAHDVRRELHVTRRP
jgi:uncharacterized OsmC-like protein